MIPCFGRFSWGGFNFGAPAGQGRHEPPRPKPRGTCGLESGIIAYILSMQGRLVSKMWGVVSSRWLRGPPEIATMTANHGQLKFESSTNSSFLVHIGEEETSR